VTSAGGLLHYNNAWQQETRENTNCTTMNET